MEINEAKSKLFKILKNKSKVFIITGKNSFYKTRANKIFSQLFKTKKIQFYFKEGFVPEIKELKIISNLIFQFNPDIILGIGGGTVLDYSKIVSCVPTSEINKKKIILGKIKFLKKYLVCAIPTTAGSGAEVTSNAVIYIGNKKYSFESSSLLPDHFLLIPSFVLGANKKIKASSGFDTISQAIESLISLRSTDQSVIYAKKSLNFSIKYFSDFLTKPNNTNSLKMSLAANFSGKAINISKTTAPHAVSYPFTSYFGISHGHAVSLTIDKFLLFNYQNIAYSNSNFSLKNRYEILFGLTKTKNIIELILFLKQLKRNANLVDDFKKLNIDIRRHCPMIINDVSTLRLKNNPIKLEKVDLKNILLSKNKEFYV